jgi:hypothetical protein
MKKIYYLLPILILLFITVLSCQSVPSGPDDIHMFTFNPEGVDSNQNGTQPANQPSPDNGSQEIVRNEVVTEQNSIFSIGIPAKYTEKTEVTADKPVDFWFEYVPDNMQLKVNNQLVPRDPTKWETKLSYTQNVTKFNYEAKNPGNEMISYNLHIVPSTGNEQVKVKVVQKYIPD